MRMLASMISRHPSVGTGGVRPLIWAGPAMELSAVTQVTHWRKELSRNGCFALQAPTLWDAIWSDIARSAAPANETRKVR